MIPGIYNFTLPQKRGDTFNGFQFEINVEVNGVLSPVDFTGAVIKMQVRKNRQTAPVAEWLTSDGSITISGVNNNEINIAAKTGPQMDIEEDTYLYDINVVLANGVTNTYVEGRFSIGNNISH